ncbi:hypothetical protein GQR58_003262 [Nymphon striatum]|nr:hypothetical protein GQR58_003262 [Nymphon striatum]
MESHMPYIEVKIAKKRITKQEVRILSSGITEVMSGILNKKRSLVAVSIETIDPDKWFVAEKEVLEHELTTAFVSARITEGTNTVKEKEDAIEAINQLLNQVLGTMTEASYIVLEALPSTDWGYSGKTQEYRKLSNKSKNGDGTIDYQHHLRKSQQLRSDCIFSVFDKFANRLRQLVKPV